MKLHKVIAGLFTVCLFAVALVGISVAQGLEESGQESLTLRIQGELQPENSDSLFPLDEKIIISLHLATFTELKLEAQWIIYPDQLVQTNEGTYANINTDPPGTSVQ